MAKGSGGTKASMTSNGIPTGTHFHKIDVNGVKEGIINLDGRMITIVNINGVDVPFYISTGKGGKAGVESGKWYPFFGIDPDGWFNKGQQSDIVNYYGSPRLKAVAQALDKKFGDIRGDKKRKVVPSSFKENPTLFEHIRRQINKDVKGEPKYNKPGAQGIDYAEFKINGWKQGSKEFYDRIEKIKKRIG